MLLRLLCGISVAALATACASTKPASETAATNQIILAFEPEYTAEDEIRPLSDIIAILEEAQSFYRRTYDSLDGTTDSTVRTSLVQLMDDRSRQLLALKEKLKHTGGSPDQIAPPHSSVQRMYHEISTSAEGAAPIIPQTLRSERYLVARLGMALNRIPPSATSDLITQIRDDIEEDMTILAILNDSAPPPDQEQNLAASSDSFADNISGSIQPTSNIDTGGRQSIGTNSALASAAD